MGNAFLRKEDALSPCIVSEQPVQRAIVVLVLFACVLHLGGLAALPHSSLLVHQLSRVAVLLCYLCLLETSVFSFAAKIRAEHTNCH